MKNLFVLVLLMAVSQTAYAGVGLLGGMSFHSVSTDNNGSNQNFSSSSKLGFIGGLSFSSNFLLLNVEADALYDNRTLNILGTGISSPAINIPILARFSVIPTILDVGVGPYGSFNVGNNNLDYSSPDFGAVGSVRVMIPIPGIHLLVDGRYDFGFTNLSQIPGVTLHTREFQVMAGIDIPFMSDDSSHSSSN